MHHIDSLLVCLLFLEFNNLILGGVGCGGRVVGFYIICLIIVI